MLAGGKRPSHTIIPGFMEKGDQHIGFGIMGGSNQAMAHAQFVSNVVDYGMRTSSRRWNRRGSSKNNGAPGCDVRIEGRVPAAVIRRPETTRSSGATRPFRSTIPPLRVEAKRSYITRRPRRSSARRTRGRMGRQCRSPFGSRSPTGYNEGFMRVLSSFVLLAVSTCAQTLPVNWRIQPAGTQVALDSLPLSAAVSPDGKFLTYALNAGGHPSISVVDTSAMKETARVAIADAGLGVAFSPDGRRLYAGGGSRNVVFEFTFSPAGDLKPSREISTGQPAGSINGTNFIGDVAVSPDAVEPFLARPISSMTASW